jgi:Uri superfamily endonuclease
VGTASRGLTKRVERHLRKRTVLRWHIDYLKGYAGKCTAIPIRASDSQILLMDLYAGTDLSSRNLRNLRIELR